MRKLIVAGVLAAAERWRAKKRALRKRNQLGLLSIPPALGDRQRVSISRLRVTITVAAMMIANSPLLAPRSWRVKEAGGDLRRRPWGIGRPQ